MLSDDNIFFEVPTPLGFQVRTSIGYWDVIVTIKHPGMRGREEDVKRTLTDPDEIRVSKTDPMVFLFYRADGNQRWVCAVTKRLDDEGFLITTYRTSNIKEGTRIWLK